MADDMETFVQASAQRFAATEQTTRTASTGLLRVVRDSADEETFGELLSRVPGIAALLEAVQAGESEPYDLFGAMLGTAGEVVRGHGGSSAGLLGLLTNAGISAANVGPFVAMFLKFLEQKAGSELADRVSRSLPNLKELVG
jgi:hypothetical protein